MDLLKDHKVRNVGKNIDVNENNRNGVIGDSFGVRQDAISGDPSRNKLFERFTKVLCKSNNIDLREVMEIDDGAEFDPYFTNDGFGMSSKSRWNLNKFIDTVHGYVGNGDLLRMKQVNLNPKLTHQNALSGNNFNHCFNGWGQVVISVLFYEAIKLNTSKESGKTDQQKLKLLFSYGKSRILIDRVLIFYPNYVILVVVNELGMRIHGNPNIYDFVPLVIEALDVGLRHKNMMSDFTTKKKLNYGQNAKNGNKSSAFNGFYVKKFYCKDYNMFGQCRRNNCKFKHQCDKCDGSSHGRNTCPVGQQSVANENKTM